MRVVRCVNEPCLVLRHETIIRLFRSLSKSIAKKMIFYKNRYCTIVSTWELICFLQKSLLSIERKVALIIRDPV